MRIIVAFALVLTSCTIDAQTLIDLLTEENHENWVGTWTTAGQLTEPGNRHGDRVKMANIAQP